MGPGGFDAGLIRLERKQVKNRKPRTAPIYGDMRAVLEMAKAERDAKYPECRYVVNERGQRIHSLKTAWRHAFECAGLMEETDKIGKDGKPLRKPISIFHDLRRTAATNMDAAGISRERIKDCVGWKTDAMFSRYRIGSDLAALQTGKQMEQWMRGQNEVGASRQDDGLRPV